MSGKDTEKVHSRARERRPWVERRSHGTFDVHALEVFVDASK